MDMKFITEKPRVEPWVDPLTGEIYPNGKPAEYPPRELRPTEIPKSGGIDAVPTPARIEQAPQPQFIQPHYTDAAPERPNTDSSTTKFCSHCGSVIPKEAVICRDCGCQVGYIEPRPQQIIINNNPNMLYTQGTGKPKSKATSLILCILAGWVGAHRFYEGKVASGILYLFTGGLFGIGVLVDIVRIANLPDTYYPK